MSYKIKEYPKISERVQQLGLISPTHLAILPENFDTTDSYQDLRQAGTASTVMKLWRAENIKFDRLDKTGKKFPNIHNRDSAWIGPTIYIGAALLSENPSLISIALDLISNYLTDFFKGITENKTIKLNIVVETQKSKKVKRI